MTHMHRHDVTSHHAGHSILIKHARSYHLLAGLLFGGRRRRVYQRLAELSGASPGDRVLDVGCGTGYLTRVMAAAVGPTGTVVGVDPSPEALEHAQRRARSSNIAFSTGAAESLEAAESSYDVVVTSLMIHHLPEDLRPQAFSEMYRVLRPGGRVIVADFRPPRSRMGRLLVLPHVPAMQNNPVHLIEPMVRDAGFEQVDAGDIRPWIRYVRGTKPHNDTSRASGDQGATDV